MSQNKEDLKNKIIYRASYRGTKEMDILMTAFVKSFIDELDEDLLKILDTFVFGATLGFLLGPSVCQAFRYSTISGFVLVLLVSGTWFYNTKLRLLLGLWGRPNS